MARSARLGAVVKARHVIDQGLPRIMEQVGKTIAGLGQLWENDDLKAFPIFPSGVRYILRKIKDKTTFPIFLKIFPEEKLTSNLA
ncbi:hypothetical protein DVH24_020900 [Malus domestica]|uniref:Uncharacterized protein n=1 Tax=Malus domestica TaxID=3750 RepID=A0A498JAS9_MALDO|nr:hypothetical protein DVH24_020900 [Malus domestica]